MLILVGFAAVLFFVLYILECRLSKRLADGWGKTIRIAEKFDMYIGDLRGDKDWTMKCAKCDAWMAIVQPSKVQCSKCG